MNLSAPFVRRPVGTLLLTLAVALVGIASFFALPVAPLPQIDFPTIRVTALMPGASPTTMGASVAAPLEKRLGAIAGLTEMTSSSVTGTTLITLQFDLGRDVNGAARDVQAALAAARADLPTTLRMNPAYQKINPADAPIMILALTSNTRSPSEIYDAVSSLVQQRLLQVQGIGDAELGGASLPAVRVELNPLALARFGITLEDVRTALLSTGANRPKGVIEDGRTAWLIQGEAPALKAAGYRDLIIAHRAGAAVRLADVATVRDGPEDVRTMGLFNGKRAVNIILRRQPGANVIATVDAVKAALPELQAAMPADIRLTVASDLSTTIRASVEEVEVTLVISVLLVVAVVSLFLRSLRATIVPAVAVVTSLLGTLGIMYLLGYSLNNLSLMALTIATGFVVDDAIVVLENIARHIEKGMQPIDAALKGAREVGFTVVSISLSLVAVFIPLLFMGGLPGRLFREFAVTMAVAVLISLIVSLVTTPMLSALLLRKPTPDSRFAAFTGRQLDRLQRGYAMALDVALSHRALTLATLGATILFNIVLIAQVPKGFFPQQDIGSAIGSLQVDEGMSFARLQRKLADIAHIIGADPGVENVVAFTGGLRAGGGFLFVTLKEPGNRDPAPAIIDRLRPRLAGVTGIRTFLNPVQDLRVGGRQANASYQYTLTANDQAVLATAVPRLSAALRHAPAIVDLSDDLSAGATSAYVEVDRAAASRIGVTMQSIDQTLYDALGQRQVATLYSGLNQYHIVMGLAPRFADGPDALAALHVPATGSLETTGGGRPPGQRRDTPAGAAISTAAAIMTPLSAIARWSDAATPSQINHQSGSPAATLSFNTAGGFSLGDAARQIAQARDRAGFGSSIAGGFAGTAKVFQQSFSTMPLLILAAIATIYIVLGILYESMIHPLTVLSTLPSAGVGAVIALMLAGKQLDLIGIIGIILLIGIVKKNAILIIDFALDAERNRGLTPLEAIREASLMRFRPILMTTLAAALGAVPLAIGFGIGSELRQPLGIAVFGGLLASQMLTLFTTPVVYLALDRFRRQRAGRPDKKAQPA